MDNAQLTDQLSAQPTVFVSYSRGDRKRASPIIAQIEAAGFSVWWDGLLAGGARFSQQTEAALETAKAVVVLWSKTSVASHWVHDEATRGRDRGCLVPLSVDGTEPPLGFRQFQVIDVSHAKLRADDPEMQRVVRAIAALHGAEDGAPMLNRTAHSPPISRRALGIGGAAFAVAGVAAGWQAGLFGDAKATENSVAVLPFRNLSGDARQDYLSEGLSEEIRATLSRNPLLRVAAPTSARQVQDSANSPGRISEQLAVDFLLSGSVRQAGATLKIIAELVSGKTGVIAWSRTFDRKLDDVFAMQSDIADTVTEALSAQVASTQQVESNIGATKNAAAFDAYLRGKALFDSNLGETSDRAALAQFDAAISADPKYATAHAARAKTLSAIANGTSDASTLRGLYDGSVESARSAVRLGPGLAGAWAALGYAYSYGLLDMRSAKQPYRKARELGWGDADVLISVADYCTQMAWADEAQASAQRAAILDPLNPRVFRMASRVAYFAGRYDQSIPLAQKALVLSSKLGGCNAMIGNAFLALGKIDEAGEAYNKEPLEMLSLPGAAIVKNKEQDTAKAGAALASLIAKFGDNGLYQQAQVHAQAGDKEKALLALERGRVIGDSGLLMMRVDPLLIPLRPDPRFSGLLKAIGLS